MAMVMKALWSVSYLLNLLCLMLIILKFSKQHGKDFDISNAQVKTCSRGSRLHCYYKVIQFRWHDKNGFSNDTYTIQQFCPLLIYKKAVTNTPSIILLTLKLYPQTKRKERYLKPKAFHTTINKFGS